MMKLMKAKEKPLDKLTWPMWGEVKLDGVRLAIIVTPQQHVTVQTYNGKEVKSTELKNIFRFVHPGVYDGELIWSDGKSDKRTKISGSVNSAIKGGDLTMPGKTLVLFDYNGYDEHMFEQPTDSYEERRALLNNIFRYCDLAKYCCIRVTEALLLTGPLEAQQFYSDLIEAGFEGLMLKVPGHKYSYKRSVDWIKMKETKTMDLICTDVKEGTGKYVGMIGALYCVDDVANPTIGVWVGSGLTDADRAKDWFHYVSETIEVKYNTVISDKDRPNLNSLFLPRFSCVRFDK